MAVPTLRKTCKLRLAEDLVKDGYGCIALEKSRIFVLSQLDQGAWGVESLAILEWAVKHFNFFLNPRVILALLPSNTKNLALKQCPLLSEDCLNAIIERCSNLESLDLTENTCLNFSAFNLCGTVFFEKNKSLSAVSLEDCHQVNNVHIQTLLLNAPNLQNLNIARCDVTDTVFLLNEQKQLAREACFQIDGLTSEFDSKLQTVDVSRCEKFSSTGVRHLCTLCGPTLQNINLSWTKVDCTALLYLSGMGLPHAVQFYMSTSVMDSSSLESLVYTLHQFDAICEDISENWVNKNQAEESLAAPEESEDIETQAFPDKSFCENVEYQTPPLSLHDIRPTLDDIVDEKCDSTDIFITSKSNEKESQLIQASNTDSRNTAFSDNTFIYGNSFPESKNTSSLSPNLCKTDALIGCEGEIDPENKVPVLSCSLQDVPESPVAVTSEKYVGNEEKPLSLLFSTSDEEKGEICNESIDKSAMQDVIITGNEDGPVSDDVECNDVEKYALSIDSLNCDDLKKDDISNIQFNENGDTACPLDITTSDLLLKENINFEENENAYDGNFFSSTGELLHLSADTDSSSNDDQFDEIPAPLLETEKVTRPCRCSKGSKMKMDFAPNIISLQVNGIIFKEENTGVLCLQTFLKANENLHSLTLYGGMTGNFVTDLILDLIGHYSHKLTYLSIEGCDQVTNIGATAIAKNCKDLATMDLTGVPFLGDPGIIHFLRSLSLKHLLMAETQITGLSLDAMTAMPYVSELKELDLSWCEEIAGETSLNQLLELCSSLKRLMLRETPLTANTLSLIAENCHNITELSIASNMSNVTDESVCLLSENLPFLENIDLSWNSHLTDKSIHSLFNNCHHLWNANLEGLKRMTSSALVPIIVVSDELKDFLVKHNMETSSEGNTENTEVIFELLPCLPHRSTTYCTKLRSVNLKYSDFVEDARLQELVTVTQGGIKVIDYYGEEVEISKSALEKLLKRYSMSASLR